MINVRGQLFESGATNSRRDQGSGREAPELGGQLALQRLSRRMLSSRVPSSFRPTLGRSRHSVGRGVGGLQKLDVPRRPSTERQGDPGRLTHDRVGSALYAR
jgi:hypothetical protein